MDHGYHPFGPRAHLCEVKALAISRDAQLCHARHG
jgi:hypothetical protein